MAGRYSKEELKDKLQRSTFSLVASGGIESVTVRKVATGCGLSDPYIYQCYSDLTDLMTDTFMRIDKEIAYLIASVIRKQAQTEAYDLEEKCWLLWSAYWKFLMDYAERTIFYWRFYQSGYYTKELLEERQKNFAAFIDFVQSAGAQLGFSDITALDSVVSMIIDDSVSVAVKIHLGYMPQSAVSAEDIYRSVFSLLFHKLGLHIWDTTLPHQGGLKEER